jgi:hypothetical protein
MTTAPIGPGVESVSIELYAAAPTAARWDQASWDGATWGALAWQAIACQVGEATTKWGASEEAGILSTAEAGELDFNTLDPDRILDPMNAASPFYGAVRPGTPIRLSAIVPGSGSQVVATGFIDEASYDVAAQAGRIRAIDGIAYLAQAQVPDATVLPNTLRARARSVVAAVALGNVISIPADGADVDPDPAVAPFDGKAAAAWEIITDAALDALNYVWLDPTGVLRFASWGAFPDAAVSLGCAPPGGGGGQWVQGISTIEATAAANAIRNSVRAWSSTSVFAPAAIDSVSIQRYGPRPLDVERVVPNLATWTSRILADRADAGLGLALGEIRPYTAIELEALLDAELLGPAHVNVRDDSHGEVIDLDVATIGGSHGITPGGWRFQWVTMIPRAEWSNVTPEPPDPPIPPPDPWHVETRTYLGATDALLALTSGGAKYGAGAASSSPVGAWQGWTYRSCLSFASIPWTKIRALRTATLKLQTSTQIRVGFGSSPTIEARRITETWSAGSASSPSGSNSVVYPGPATTTSGAVRANVTTSQSAAVAIRVDAIVKAWAPSSAGGSGQPQRGIMLVPGSGSGADTTEFMPVEAGGSARPSLELVLEVFD